MFTATRLLRTALLAVALGCSTEEECTSTIGNCGAPQSGPSQTCGDRPPAESGVQLSIDLLPQPCSQWCWAAVSTVVGRYFGRPTSQCELASLKTGRSCCQYGSCVFDACDQPALGEELTTILSRHFGLHGRWLGSPIPEEDLRTELSNGRPVIVGFQGPFAGHVAVVTGFAPGTPTTYRVLDPWPAYGEISSITYSELRNGPMMPWTQTWLGLSPRQDGCVPSFDASCGCGSQDPGGGDPPAAEIREGLDEDFCEAHAYCPQTGQTVSCQATPYSTLTDNWSGP